MSEPIKPRLLFLRFTKTSLPAFIRLHLRQQVECLARHFEVVVVDEPHCDYAQLCDTHQPDLAVFESGVFVAHRSVANVSAHPSVPKLGFVHCDAYCPTREVALDDMMRWGISAYFTTSVTMAAYAPAIADDLFSWPNAVDTSLYRDYGLTKSIPVLFTGSQAIHYPWRNRINALVSQRYPTLQCPHMGWDLAADRAQSGMLMGESYARLINAAVFAPTCGTFANDFVRKHLEIPACATCLVTEQTPTVEAAGFADMENCVFADTSTVLDKLEWLLQRPSELSRITEAGRRLVADRHTVAHRDQVFQWYTLRRNLPADCKIVQPDPFGPLAVTRRGAPAADVIHVRGGIDRDLMSAGDAAFGAGRHADAEVLYRRCRNYYDLPEATLRIALCQLHQGAAGAAATLLAGSISSVQERSGPGSRPDPVEWAYLIAAALCGGDLRLAVRRAGEYRDLQHLHLNRVRALVGCLQGGVGAPGRADDVQPDALSLHDLPLETPRQWLAEVTRMLRACRQEALADKLTHQSDALATVLEQAEMPTARRSPDGAHSGLTQTRSRTSVRQPDTILGRGPLHRAARRRVRMAVLPAWRALQSVLDPVLPPKWSAVRSDPGSTLVRRICRFEQMSSVLLLGAAAGDWLTEAVLGGLPTNPQLPAATCVSESAEAASELARRFAHGRQVRSVAADSFDAGDVPFDMVVVACNRLGVRLQAIGVPPARIIILGDITSETGDTLWRQMLGASQYFIEAHDPGTAQYGVFRRFSTARASSGERLSDRPALRTLGDSPGLAL